ncbi:ABC transporter ATP-binding protein [Dermatophilus congolensis]|uniref:ABC transporter ATP-binding protein n=1 Tax=Dermatophilus congolensis TaxID=1863 RepID=UPI001AAF548A|nr:ATP-binding cassette domain-containing protein [Dermatophilus congolensis]MBO3143615.1 ABC transporter ATP-binding protein [Dermatophilus congolensis]MBO3152608.1 ABC transporter ATP-binding protein [Dermatophilus congolensis]MBO3160381.1 ABC transporter ATP-binding protein [Dermatophilus congolensis]MBO3163892.1 ABC transporter ATP-binding protein [Dermatophilus congolensis]MBO3177439.1 ABC transporter ATP-binding protein [Dermatophilus congolensis]
MPDTEPSRPTSPGLVIENLTRRFSERLVVDNLSFTVAPGTITGFVGANGAGKTTTMRMIMGVLAPTSGHVYWNNRPINDNDRYSFGYMPEERGLYQKQKVLDQLIYLGRIHGMGKTEAKRSASEYLERFGLGDRAEEPLEKLSLGNQQRVQITAALMNNPQCLILDEPFSGLDPTAIDAMSAVLVEQSKRGVPILFSSHQLDLIDRLCHRLVILANGRLVGSGTSNQLRAAATKHHRLVLTNDAGWVRGIPGVSVIDLEGNTAILNVIEDQARQHLLSEALNRGGIEEFAPLVPTLSEIYREVTA